MIHRNWIAGPGLDAEYELKKREQEELLQEQEVTRLVCCFAADLQIKPACQACLLCLVLCFLKANRLNLLA